MKKRSGLAHFFKKKIGPQLLVSSDHVVYRHLNLSGILIFQKLLFDATKYVFEKMQKSLKFHLPY